MAHKPDDEHPLKKYFSILQKDSIDADDYLRRKQFLADSLGISLGTLYNLANPKQTATVNVNKALTLEIITNGHVPADSVCPGVEQALDLAGRVLKLRGKPKKPAISPKAQEFRDKAGAEFDNSIWPIYPKRANGNPKGPARQKYIIQREKGVINIQLQHIRELPFAEDETIQFKSRDFR